MALFAEISGAESLGEIGAGAESCSEVRAQNAHGRVKSANLGGRS
jgi:hypothetical protein